MRISTGLLTGVAFALFTVGEGGGQDLQPRPAVPVEPTSAILDAFRFHQVLALGEGIHGNEQSHQFRLALIRNPRFAQTVNDIVVEFGNSLYQDVMDRFVGGEDVSNDALRQVWQNTTQPNAVWDRPIYEDFFRAVRDLNARLPRQEHVRVILGDPPADWSRADTPVGFDALNAMMDERDSYPADLIQREVLAKNRRALLIWGDAHLMRNEGFTLVGRLEGSASIRVFVVSTNTSVDLQKWQPDVAQWPIPSLTHLASTTMGATDFALYFLGPPPPPGAKPVRLEDRYDALLYLGPPSTIKMVPLSPSLCADPAYVKMRLMRIGLFPQLQVLADRFKQGCASTVR